MEYRNKKTRSNSGGEVVIRSSVPRDLLHFNIIPRLSFKSLSRFKNVSKAWHDLISNDSFFAVEQSRRPSPTSSGFVYFGCRGLEFLSSPNTPVGIPDPSLSFLNSHLICRLVASTNGLLCLYVHALYFNFLCVLNPATQDYESIPQSKHRRYGVGLAFDPSTSPTHYALVYPERDHVHGTVDEVDYRFDVFSSRTGKWVKSSQKITVSGFKWRHQTPVFAGGALYWDCVEYLIWLDPCKDLAGWMLLPESVSSGPARHAIGASEGRVTCMVVLEDAVEVFLMKDGYGSINEWSKIYRVSLERMVEENRQVFAEFCNMMRLRSRKLSERLFWRWFIQPLAFEGGDKLYLWVRAVTGRRERDRVLRHDFRTGVVTMISNNVNLAPGEDQIFTYHNSMASLPKWLD